MAEVVAAKEPVNVTKTAQQMGEEQREISISQFFEKNRHLLGYDNKAKALLTIIREGVDNALDACEEARILPDISVKLEEVDKEKFKIVIKDNGPGIVKKQIPNIFGKLLYGSKFHRLKQQRGQQGIGVSGAALYAQLTTGEPLEIVTSTGDGKLHRYKQKIDVKHNQPVILEDSAEDTEKWHGVRLTFVAEGVYREGKQSVLEYLKQVAVANPYANIAFDSPSGKTEFKRGADHLPKEPKEIQPHLMGVEVGIMSRMLHDTKARTMATFFTAEFSRIGTLTANEICKKASIDPKISPRKISDQQVVEIVKVVKEMKLIRPPTDCLSPLGEKLIESGLKKEFSPEWVASISRPPEVYRGFPFQVEVGIAYGGGITEPRLLRFANRVPLLYQQGDCAITKGATEIDWKRYGIESDKFPTGPVVVFLHLASVWVPFTSESKEAIANYPVIIKEIKLGIQECARKLSLYLSGMRRAQRQAERLAIFERYAPETAKALEELTGTSAKKIIDQIKKIVTEKGSEIEEEENEGDETGPGEPGGEPE
ncbi:MAG: DNA topoisomerase VI subunit B [Candidatus Aenigmarchaeota archaeon]|nr:DNA topoisomerase VI subunit B [Candidatus Aenigmarchaeota archaeon]